MELAAAIKGRKSIRGYKPDPVSKETLADILSLATRAPSALNTQPWEIMVVTGKPLAELKQAIVELTDAGVPGVPDIKGAPFTGVYRQRQVALAIQLFGLLGIARGEREKMGEWRKSGNAFYGAPAAIIMAADRTLTEPGCSFDAGCLAQTICLAALQHGLGTCIMTQSLASPETIKRITGIPEEKRLITCITIGYPDWDFPANRIQTEREPLENVVSWCGFE